jgi:uncharacterized membrane protein YjjB (DUF3815 family)
MTAEEHRALALSTCAAFGVCGALAYWLSGDRAWLGIAVAEGSVVLTEVSAAFWSRRKAVQP